MWKPPCVSLKQSETAKRRRLTTENDVFIRLLHLPPKVRAVTLPNHDGTFDIYVNDCLPKELQYLAIRHELAHIEKDHFYNEDPVAFNEIEAG